MDVESIWDTRGNGKKKGNVKPIESRFHEIKPRLAVSFYLDHLGAWSLAKCLRFSSVPEIYFR